jgi:hypothetical protein
MATNLKAWCFITTGLVAGIITVVRVPLLGLRRYNFRFFASLRMTFIRLGFYTNCMCV